MSNSSLVNVRVPASTSNYTRGRDYKISKITVHHMAGILTADRCGRVFQSAGRGASAHYGVGSDGKIGQYVDESNTAWADANRTSNHKSVTIEVANSSTGGSWPVSDRSLQPLIKLCADIAKRNGLGKLVVGKNLTWHSMYCATTCPGNYLRSKMSYIAAEANKIIDGGSAEKELYRVRKSWSDSKSQLGAFAVFNNAKALADKNRGYKVFNGSGVCVYPETAVTLYRVRKTWADASSQLGAFKTLANAKALADNNAGYNVFDPSGKCIYTPSAPAKKTNLQIAREVIRGNWGNGAERKKRLAAAGYDYNAVQSIVNSLM